jgi:hypothetical protein
MSSAFKRKQYGKVRPVPKPKPKAPSKPSVHALRAIYRDIQKSPEWQLNDLLSEALLWWKNVLTYCHWKYRKMLPLEAARALIAAENLKGKGNATTKNEEKTKCFIEALNKYQRFAVGAITVPALAPYLKRSKEVTKKTKIRTKQLTTRFDSLLTLLTQCFDEPRVELRVQDVITDKVSGKDVDYKWDHELHKLYYSRSKCLEMKSTLHKQGLLAVVLEEANEVARGLSLLPDGGDGTFMPSAKIHHIEYLTLLSRFEQFAHTTVAPKSLVRREKKKKVAGKPKGTFPKKKGQVCNICGNLLDDCTCIK